MLQGLPDDILLELVEAHLSGASNAQSREAVCNLSLTSRRFRSFAIRVLYHSLSFRTDFHRTTTSQDIMTSMIYNHTRAKHLIQSRHLLRNVQRLSLHHWDGDLPNSPGFSDLGADDVKKMREVIYDNLTRLVPHVPRLKEFGLVECAMTPFLYAAISACPLNLLHVRTDSPPDFIYIPTGLPQQLHITNLHYCYTHPTWKFSDDGKLTDPFVDRIFQHSISSLEELSVNSALLPTFVSCISNKALSLKYLSVSFPARNKGRRPVNAWQINVARSLWDILLASPQLQTLIINGSFSPTLLPQDLVHHVLPNLVEVSARSYVLPVLTQGRDLQRIHMSQWFGAPGNMQPIIQLIRCSPTHLRQLSVTFAKAQTVSVLMEFIQSLSVFHNLASLNVTYDVYSTLWAKHDFQEISNTITNLLQDLAGLHTCHIWDIDGSDSPKSPPLLMHPRSLDHPSLRVLGVDFFTKNVWYWDAEAGWMVREWKPTQAQKWCDRNQFSEI